MVIANSDSNTTLVSLDNYGLKVADAFPSSSSDGVDCVAEVSQEHHHRPLYRTELRLVEEDVFDFTSSSSSSCSSNYWTDDNDSCCDGASDASRSTATSTTTTAPLYLPEDGQYLDEYLKHHASIRDSCEELLRSEPRRFTTINSDGPRLLYVGQGERANATTTDCDVLVSDKATTCHILALRSSRSSSCTEAQLPLASLTHIDGTSYEKCIRKMFEEHILHHSKSTTPQQQQHVTIDIHVMGGFNDQDSTSSTITDWLLGLLAQIAEEYNDSTGRRRIKCDMVLKTCAVSCLNDTGYSCPIGRGLGMDVHTGQVFLASCHHNITGPAPLLRSVRLWSKGQGPVSALSVVHSVTDPSAYTSGHMVVQPFRFAPFADIPSLLALPDDVLLQYTSTSPDVEEDGFCQSVRASLRFLLQHKCHHIFGRNVDQPLVFARVSSSNEWKQL